MKTESTSLSKPSNKRKLILSPDFARYKFDTFLKINKSHHCPFCEHCNSLKDESLNKLQYHCKETCDFIAKSVQYILKENYKGFSSFFNDNFHLGNSNSCLFEKEKNECAGIVDILFNHPKHHSHSTKDMYKVLNMFLNSLIENKIAIEELIKGTEVNKDDLITNKYIKGFTYDELDDNVLIDKEFENLFDQQTKEKLIEVIKEEYLNKVSPFRAQIVKNETESNKKLLILFLILTQCLSETLNESKERAVLLFKVFKMYFVELNKKLMNVIDHFKAKNEYYRELCRGIIKERTPDLINIDLISSTLLNTDVSVDNLQKHKDAINALLSNVKRYQDNYINIKSQMGIETSFCRKWIYGYDKLKNSYNLHQAINTIGIAAIADFIFNEVKSKDYSEEVILLLTNVEIFQRLSGVKNYLFEQKIFYQQELARLTEANQNLQFKKNKYKTELRLKEEEWSMSKMKYEEQIMSLKAKLNQMSNEDSTQTDIDYFQFNKYQKNTDVIEIHKRLTINKIDDFLLRIKYKCSKYFPLSKTSLLKLIPELIHEKKESDEECEKISTSKLFFSEFFVKYFIDKFKLKKIIQQNTEETIMAILKYSSEDKRIDYFRRFLSIGSDPIRREVLDIFLIILTELPFSYHKLFYEDNYEAFLLSTEFALEILYTRFKIFNFARLMFKSIIFSSSIYDKSNRKISKGISIQNKDNLFYLYRLYQRGKVFINDLLINLKNNTTDKVSVNDLMKHLKDENKEYELNNETCYSAINNNFKINTEDNSVNLTEFCNFFLERKTFKIAVFDFIELCINQARLLFDYIELKAKRIFESIDVKNTETLNQKQFYICINLLIRNQTNNWKMNEFFDMATRSQNIGFIGKEEFIDFVLNTNDLLVPLIKQYLDDINF